MKVNDVVVHKNGNEYIITKIPSKYKQLEYCRESYYEYKCKRTHIEWIRRKSEFEDGRFKVIGHLTVMQKLVGGM